MKDLVLSQVSKQIEISSEYSGMLEHIQSNLPAITASSQNFYKSASQYKNVTLDVTDLTPMSSLKHVLAVIDQTRLALEDSYFKTNKSKIKLKKKQLKYSVMEDGYDKDLLEVEIQELETGLRNGTNYVNGAIRKLSFFVTQYNSLLEKIGKTEFTEEDYEKEESRYHVMTAVKQALIAARARGGLIDEGNHIYLFDMGINGAALQREITAYFEMEQDLMNKGTEPSHEMTIHWLEAVADKYADCGAKFAESRGFVSLDRLSLTNGELNVIQNS